MESDVVVVPSLGISAISDTYSTYSTYSTVLHCTEASKSNCQLNYCCVTYLVNDRLIDHHDCLLLVQVFLSIIT